MQILPVRQHGQIKTRNKNDKGRELADIFLLTFYNFETLNAGRSRLLVPQRRLLLTAIQHLN